MENGAKRRAPRNRSITLSPRERESYLRRCLRPTSPLQIEEIQNGILHGELFRLIPLLPLAFIDLLIVDPPYNMSKRYSSRPFSRRSEEEYRAFTESWLLPLLPRLKPEASVYVCSDWRSSTVIHRLLSEHLIVRNRITWEREKGRGAKSNWKNSSEDIWFATVGKSYYFDVDAVKLKRRVLAPYRDSEGNPKDWRKEEGEPYRLTSPSNIWTDITVPYWSMPENTEHPTQKPEKLFAKLILASSSPGALVADPFVGSGTSSVAAKKLGRRYLGIEREEEYAALAQKRLEIASRRQDIQGLEEGVFLDRNVPKEKR